MKAHEFLSKDACPVCGQTPCNCTHINENIVKEFAPTRQGGGGDDYIRALASAWYNDTFNTGSLQKGIKSQEDVERILERGVICNDGKRRKYSIGYNANFDGVELASDDYYEYDDGSGKIDSRTNKPWGPYEHIEFHDSQLDENLRKWFKEKWVRFGPDGKIRGDCARGSEGEGKPKCLPQSKAHALGKKGRATAASRKRREDPNPERSGKAINVKTKESQLDELKCWPGHHRVPGTKAGTPGSCAKNESVEEAQQCPECGGPMFSELMINEKQDACYYKVKSRYKVWPSAYASGALVQCRKKGAKNWGNKSKN